MSVITEYKWYINYIQTLFAQIQQKMLQKILEKVSITKKCTQRKTLHTLKTDVFELPDNKNIRKLVSKYQLFSLDQANFSSDPSQILVLQYPTRTASLPPSSFLSNFTLKLKPLFNAIPIMFSIGYLIFSYTIRPHATIIEYAKPYAKPSQSNLLSSYI